MVIRYYLLPGLEIARLYRLEKYRAKLRDYLQGREGVLDTPVLLSETTLSRHIADKDFSLFRRVDTPEPGAFIVLGLYLELLEYWNEGELMIRILQDMSRQYPQHICLAIYNHDNDFAKYNAVIPENVRILNHGWTSSPSPKDICLPFWKVVDNPYRLPKTIFASFIGTPNNQARQVLVNSITAANRSDILHKRVYGDGYLRLLASTLYSLVPRGAGVSSWRLYEAIQARSIPVLLVDIPHLPMEEILDWSTVCIRLPESLINDPAEIVRRLQSIDPLPYLDAIEAARLQLNLHGTQRYLVSRLTQSSL